MLTEVVTLVYLFIWL